MSLASIVTPDIPKSVEYPRLMVSKSQGFIVLVTKLAVPAGKMPAFDPTYEGTVVGEIPGAVKIWSLGVHLDCWGRDHFEDYHGQVLLEQP